ncbi:MAG: hypothetical protein OXM58_03070 [Rhodospirillaceae bacterium]|nr:hypothetical protein [Rhodospirillaceae bacterium]MDE0619465.1 hypothetical protein [Rhodospirillaceae bacterium]
MNGIYAMFYTGISGIGNAVFIMVDGKISGADVSGGILDGEYTAIKNNRVTFQARLTTPVGATLVTGQTVADKPITQEVSATLSANFANGSPVQIQMPMGPVNVAFRKLRDL